MSIMQQVKQMADTAAVTTGFGVVANLYLDVIQAVVAIAAGLLAGAYTAYRLYDLHDQRKKNKRDNDRG